MRRENCISILRTVPDVVTRDFAPVADVPIRQLVRALVAAGLRPHSGDHAHGRLRWVALRVITIVLLGRLHHHWHFRE